MRLLIAPTEDFIKRQRTYITQDVAAGSNVVLTVPNSSGFSVNDYIVVGSEGSEGAELVKITALTDTSLTVDVLAIAHKADEPVLQYRYNKRKFYGAETATGTYTELTGDGSPKTILVTDPQGTQFEYTGATYTYFKATYYNSTTTEETALGDSYAYQADESLRYCSIYSIRKQAGLVINPYITDGMVETYRKRAESEIKSTIMTRYTLPLQKSDGTYEVPAIIENCAVLLAAGYMDYQEFGKDGEGVKWLGEARGILKSIKTGTMRLIGTDDVELAYIANSSQLQGFPDLVDNSEGPTRKFTMNQKF